MRRAVGPVVAPADDEVAATGWMAMVTEIAALEFKFDADALPAIGVDLAQGFTVGKAVLDGFDDEAKLTSKNSKEEHDALFVERFVSELREAERVAVDAALLRRLVSSFER